MTTAVESAEAMSPAPGESHLPSYAELHCLSNFTFLRGASHPEELVSRACKLGYSALAITDECSIAGGLRFIALAPHREAYGRLCRLITRGRRASEKGTYALERLDVQALLSHCL